MSVAIPSATLNGFVRRANRETSLLRQLVPFRVKAAGAVTDATRAIFETCPDIWRSLLMTLETCDFDETPRMMLAEAFQSIMEGRLQRDVRAEFATAELECRMAYHGRYNEARARSDPLYRMTAVQLEMAAGFWHRCFQITADSWQEWLTFLHQKYTADIRRDEVITEICTNMQTSEFRHLVEGVPEAEETVKRVLLLERDLYGAHRFDKRSDRQFLMQSIVADQIGKTDDTFAIMHMSVMRNYGNFQITEKELYDGRWRNIIVGCAAESDLIPLYEEIQVPDMGPKGGVVKVWYNEPIIFRRDERDEPTFSFQLANIKVDHSLFGRLCNRPV